MNRLNRSALHVLAFMAVCTLGNFALADEINGALIVYENLTDTFSVDGTGVKGGAPGQGGRIRAMLTPKAEAKASAPQAVTPAQPGPALRPTTTLGSAPK